MPFELRPLAIELWLPENYGTFSTVGQLTPAQLFSACKRVARVVGGLLGSKELWSS
jgi:hypothetical protein